MFDDVVDHAPALLETGVLDVGARTGKATLHSRVAAATSPRSSPPRRWRSSCAHAYDWVWMLPTEAYLKLLATTSQYAVTPEPVRAGLFTELNSLLGEQVHLQATTRLHLMRKASDTES